MQRRRRRLYAGAIDADTRQKYSALATLLAQLHRAAARRVATRRLARLLGHVRGAEDPVPRPAAGRLDGALEGGHRRAADGAATGIWIGFGHRRQDRGGASAQPPSDFTGVRLIARRML